MRKRYLVPGLASILVLSVALPALGGPNPVATISAGAKKIAKRALKKSKKAQQTAKGAQSSAEAAQGAADQAQGTASQAQGAASAAQGTANAAQGAANQANLSLGGTQLARVRYVRAAADNSQTTILNLKGLRLVASCAGEAPQVVARSSVAGSTLQSRGVDGFGPPDIVDVVTRDSNFGPGDDADLLPDDTDSVTGHTEYSAPNGGQVTVNWTVIEGTAPDPVCRFTGHAIGSG